MSGTIVRLARYFKYPNIMQQTPAGKGIWGDITFTEEIIPECDYLVILDNPGADISVKVNPDNIIHLSLEPPNEMSAYRQYGNKKNKHIFNQISNGNGSILSHGALPWHLNKSYDTLSNLTLNDLIKENRIVWITSNQQPTKGHIRRMRFLDMIKHIEGVDIYGRGIKPINDKWDVLHNCKYAIAYENFNSPYYWTEKIIDCYLSFTMPLYIGSNNIANYFPSESFIQIDPDAEDIGKQLKNILSSDSWEKNIDAISYARNLILEKYQLFPFLSSFIEHHKSVHGVFNSNKKEDIHLTGGDSYFDNYPTKVIIEKNYHKILKKVNHHFSRI